MKFTVKSISADDEEEINKKKINWGEKFASKEGLRIDKKKLSPSTDWYRLRHKKNSQTVMNNVFVLIEF